MVPQPAQHRLVFEMPCAAADSIQQGDLQRKEPPEPICRARAIAFFRSRPLAAGNHAFLECYETFRHQFLLGLVVQVGEEVQPCLCLDCVDRLQERAQIRATVVLLDDVAAGREPAIRLLPANDLVDRMRGTDPIGTNHLLRLPIQEHRPADQPDGLDALARVRRRP